MARPPRHPKVSRGSSGAVALNAWGGSAGSRSEDVDAYAYPAAYAATSALVADLDDSQLAAVLGAAIRGERAYDPAGTKDADGGRTDVVALARPARDPRRRQGRRRRSSSAGCSPASSGPSSRPASKARTAYARSTPPTGPGCPPRGCATP